MRWLREWAIFIPHYTFNVKLQTGEEDEQRVLNRKEYERWTKNFNNNNNSKTKKKKEARDMIVIEHTLKINVHTNTYAQKETFITGRHQKLQIFLLLLPAMIVFLLVLLGFCLCCNNIIKNNKCKWKQISL